MLERIWAGWRSDYVNEVSKPKDDGGCVFCNLLGSGLPDEQTLVLARTDRSFAVLNLYPYGSGHLMVMPLRHVGELDGLDDDEATDLFRLLRQAAVAVRTVYEPDGMNLGANLGRAAGAGVPGHLHLHVLPRWAADTNFMTTVAETRVLPEGLDVAWRKLTEAWPS